MRLIEVLLKQFSERIMLQRMQCTSLILVTFISETSGLFRVISVSEQMSLRATNTNIQSVVTNTSVYDKIYNFSEDSIFLG